MKKLGLLSIIGCSVSGVAIAAGVDCNTIPTCAELGFIKTTTECEGKKTLRCPFDITNDSAVYCGDAPVCSDEFNLDTCPANGDCEECGNKYYFVSCNDGYTEENGSCVVEETCKAVGDILYNDLKCYTTAPSGKTAIGVVFDVTNKLAIELTEKYSRCWWNSYADVSGLENCTSNSTVTTTCGTNGKTNSAALIAAGYTNASYTAGYCQNQTTGGLAKGDWFLPSIKELNTIYTNKSTINTAITNAGGTTIRDSDYWSSTEYSSNYAWDFGMSNGSVGYSSKSYHYHVRCAVAY